VSANERWNGYSEPELLARIEAEHGPEAAAVAARFMDPDRELPWKFSHRRRDGRYVGKKAKARKAIPLTKGNPANVEELRARGLGRLPRSGAPLPPKRAPRDIESREDAS
jgi:hypothetical protein